MPTAMLKSKRTALILVDVQEKLTAVMHEKQRLIEQLQRLLRGARLLEIPILWCEQVPESLGATVEPLRDILKGLQPIEKDSFSCCRNKKFLKHFENIGPKQVLLAGIETHICVYQTAAQLADDGYEVQVVADAVSSRTEENLRIGLKRIEASGASLTSVETCLFELLRHASDPRFKELLAIVK